MIVAEYSPTYSHWNAERSLGQWLKDEGIPGLTGVDTRALTKKLREKGAMLGKIVIDSDLQFSDPNKKNLVAEVSVKEPKVYGTGKYKIIAVDCGIKYNIIRSLIQLGDGNTTVKVVPWDYDFTKEEYDGLFISNGPGDPSMVKETIQVRIRATGVFSLLRFRSRLLASHLWLEHPPRL
jgi:carbamoyl-phosphate synthase small subunit